MQYAIALALLLLSGGMQRANAVEEFRLGGTVPWSDWTGQNILVDDFSDPSALQPRELKADENLLPQLGPWYR